MLLISVWVPIRRYIIKLKRSQQILWIWLPKALLFDFIGIFGLSCILFSVQLKTGLVHIKYYLSRNEIKEKCFCCLIIIFFIVFFFIVLSHCHLFSSRISRTLNDVSNFLNYIYVQSTSTDTNVFVTQEWIIREDTLINSLLLKTLWS